MGAPTWPPTPEDAMKATLAEYGEDGKAVMALDDNEEYERKLLASLLFEAPKRELVSGEEVGTPLEPYRRSLEAWLCMVSGGPVALAPSDPPSTDGETVFLPRALPGPNTHDEDEDLALFRVMALIQLGLREFGFLGQRQFLVEIHRDWVLRNCYHILAVHYIVQQWGRAWPGMTRDFVAIRSLPCASILRVNLSTVPSKGLPNPFLSLYKGLSDDPGLATAQPTTEVLNALKTVRGVDTQAAAPLVVMGQAQRLRLLFQERRLGPPPLPWFCGVLRPEWILHDLRADHARSQEWRQGPKPLALLRKVVARKPTGKMNERVRKLVGAQPGGARPDWNQVTQQEAPPPVQDQGARVYDEWDGDRSILRLGVTRVVEVDAPSGSVDNWQRMVKANRDSIQELKRRFEALRIEERWLHGQPDGSELDLDRVIRGWIDIRTGHVPDDRWFKRFQRARDAVAILTLVDTSGSTSGNIIRLQQKAIVLLSEALKSLPFPHAFYGFSNEGPSLCRLSKLKGWEESCDENVQRRMGNLSPGGATRLGAFVRHAGWMLSRRPEGRD